jgi:hypothetical protein
MLLKEVVVASTDNTDVSGTHSYHYRTKAKCTSNRDYETSELANENRNAFNDPQKIAGWIFLLLWCFVRFLAENLTNSKRLPHIIVTNRVQRSLHNVEPSIPYSIRYMMGLNYSPHVEMRKYIRSHFIDDSFLFVDLIYYSVGKFLRNA